MSTPAHENTSSNHSPEPDDDGLLREEDAVEFVDDEEVSGLVDDEPNDDVDFISGDGELHVTETGIILMANSPLLQDRDALKAFEEVEESSVFWYIDNGVFQDEAGEVQKTAKQLEDNPPNFIIETNEPRSLPVAIPLTEDTVGNLSEPLKAISRAYRDLPMKESKSPFSKEGRETISRNISQDFNDKPLATAMKFLLPVLAVLFVVWALFFT